MRVLGALGRPGSEGKEREQSCSPCRIPRGPGGSSRPALPLPFLPQGTEKEAGRKVTGPHAHPVQCSFKGTTPLGTF